VHTAIELHAKLSKAYLAFKTRLLSELVLVAQLIRMRYTWWTQVEILSIYMLYKLPL